MDAEQATRHAAEGKDQEVVVADPEDREDHQEPALEFLRRLARRVVDERNDVEALEDRILPPPEFCAPVNIS